LRRQLTLRLPPFLVRRRNQYGKGGAAHRSAPLPTGCGAGEGVSAWRSSERLRKTPPRGGLTHPLLPSIYAVQKEAGGGVILYQNDNDSGPPVVAQWRELRFDRNHAGKSNIIPQNSRDKARLKISFISSSWNHKNS